MASSRSVSRLRSVISLVMAMIAGGLLRVWMLKHFFEVNGDSLIYGGIAKNLLLHGRYALTVGTGEMYPTLIRLPGYPLFLAGCFKVFGMENYAAAAWVQIALELAGCLLLADVARRIAPDAMKSGAAHCALWLSALVPVHGNLCRKPIERGANSFCADTGDLVCSAFSGAGIVELGAGIHLCDDLRGPAEA